MNVSEPVQQMPTFFVCAFPVFVLVCPRLLLLFYRSLCSFGFVCLQQFEFCGVPCVPTTPVVCECWAKSQFFSLSRRSYDYGDMFQVWLRQSVRCFFVYIQVSMSGSPAVRVAPSGRPPPEPMKKTLVLPDTSRLMEDFNEPGLHAAAYFCFPHGLGGPLQNSELCRE